MRIYIYLYICIYIYADVRQGKGVATARDASHSTPSANSEVIVNGLFGVISAGNGRVSPVEVFEDAQDMAVSRSEFPLTPPPRCLGRSRVAISIYFEFSIFGSS